MKTVILNPQSGYQDLVSYGKELFEKLQSNYEVVSYSHVEPDFSNIPELFDTSEKLVLFNQFSFDEGFDALTKYLPTFKNVRFILSPYSAYEGLDLELLKKMGIKYRNNGGANARSVAQYAITTMLMLLHKFPLLAQLSETADGSVLGEEFHEKTVGIIGMGNVGKEISRLLDKLGMKVVYYNRSAQHTSARQVNLAEIYEQDIVFITIATNKDTIKLLHDLPSHLQPQNYVVDVSAAEDLYDKKKVLDLLHQDKIKGYA